LRLIQAEQNSAQQKLLALKLKAGVTTKEEVRNEAASAVTSAQAGERPFRVAADATLGATLYDLVEAPKEVQGALDLAIAQLPKLQPVEERKTTLVAIGGLARHRYRAGIDRLAEGAITIADQQEKIDDGDEILQVTAPHLIRKKSLHAARRMAERIDSVGRLLSTYATLLDAHLLKVKPEYAATAIPDDKLPGVITMTTGLPGLPGLPVTRR
jgi:hypothetical protein